MTLKRVEVDPKEEKSAKKAKVNELKKQLDRIDLNNEVAFDVRDTVECVPFSSTGIAADRLYPAKVTAVTPHEERKKHL